MSKIPYADCLHADLQISMEERIAAKIFDHPDVECGEEDAAELGRDILYIVLRQFRRDLFVD